MPYSDRMAGRRAPRQGWTLRVAAAAGTALRLAGRLLPGVVGPALVAVGLGMVWLPLGLVAAGAALWLYDLLSAGPPKPRRVRHVGDGRPRPVVD